MNIFLFTSVPLAPPWDQGDKNLAYLLARSLPHVNFRVMTAHGVEDLPGSNLKAVPLFDTNRPNVLEKAFVFYRLVRIQRNGSHLHPSPDLYHLIYRPYRMSSTFLRLLPGLRKRPVIHTIPTTADQRGLGRELFFACKVVALSEYGRRKLIDEGLKNVVHIPTGVKLESLAMNQGKVERAKSELGISGRSTVLFPGHFAKGMGAEAMLRALPHIVASVPEVHLIFACRSRSAADRDNESAMRRELTHMGLQDYVSFFNTVPDMDNLIAASDILALPLENMRDKIDIPTSLLEFLSAGKPIVITDIVPMNEIFRLPEGPDVGIKVPSGNVQALGEAVIELLCDPEQRKQMGAAGRRLVAAHYDIRKVAHQYDRLYQETMR